MTRRLAKQTLDGNMETLLLAILQGGPSYGYAIVQELNQRGDGLLEMGEGTVYPLLYRLEERGLARAYWQRADNGRRRKYYRISPAGRRALQANRKQWEALVSLMDRVLGGAAGGSGGGEATQLRGELT